MQPLTAITVMLTLFLFGESVLSAQSHISVPVDHAIYYILDQAEVRGLCSPLPAVKPYTRVKIIEIINEILDVEPKRGLPRRFGGLTDGEREILENALEEFGGKAAGFDPRNGMYRFDTMGKNDVRFSLDLGLAAESLNSAAYYIEEEDIDIGTDTWVTFRVRGDIGEHFSYNVDLSAGLMKAKRVKLGDYYPYAIQADTTDPSIKNDLKETYGQPLAFFPYTYRRNWDGYVANPGPLTPSSMEGWPNDLSVALKMESEMSGSVFGDMLLLRFGRIRREWGAMTPGSSLALNRAAHPFTGIEANFNPVPWFSFSSLTGVLEFDNLNGISDPAMTFQNAYSIQQVEINYKNYFHFDFGSTAVWAKRFELGYIFPLLDNFLYQNNIGDFDNVAIYFNLKGQYPGLGKLWFSFFVDEFNVSTLMKTAFQLDCHMFAYQAGIQGIIPFLRFTSLTVSYTKIEPYNYTHRRNFLPWYDKEESQYGPMELAYVNGGESLGYYTPPNSDEIKVRFDTHPLSRTLCHLQYQLVRHGADYGRHQVDGSSLVSELDNRGRDGKEKKSLWKNFLHDGAYQWTHIIKIGAEHKLKKLPFTFFGEAGAVYSYFTDISDDEYEKYAPNFQSRPSELGDYFTSTAFILTLGFKIFK